ncbi:VIT1/CCC1 transporter family protein [Thiobacillus sp.]|uniref:VIT1/CCC1 transporter family protein n=1 Tax=Thiobacillus sp. TaxID=924 RepID=UPI00286DBBA4|nr:VIT1/CCC1 transporter family protein [Thiobacillus sp.]
MKTENEKRMQVLDPVDRVSEIIFGLIMALTFTGTISAATAGREEVRTVLYAALGCNIAWGLVDAVMYLIRTLTERTRKHTLLQRIRSVADPSDAHAIIAGELPARLGASIGADSLEDMRQRLLALPLPVRARLGQDDYIGALWVFLLVVLATFPVVIPFIFIAETALAMRVSNAIALVMLFAAGHAYGRHAGGVPWRSGLAMMAIGAALVLATIALGG